MNRRFTALLCACTALGALAILTLAIGPAKPSTAVAPDINMVAIDMDTTGNNTVTCAGVPGPPNHCAPGTIGTVQSCAAIPTVGGTLNVDIVVDAIPSGVAGSGAGPDIQGFDMDLIFGTPGIAEVTAANGANPGGPPGNLSMNYAGTPAGSHSSFTETPPDSDAMPNDFFMGEVDFGAVGEYGPGILMRLTLQAVAPGTSNLSLQYTTGGSPDPALHDNSGSANNYTIATNHGASIVVGGTCGAGTPTPTASPTPVGTPTPTPPPTSPGQTLSPTPTPSPSPTTCVTCTVSPTPSPTPSGTPTPTPTPTPTKSPTPSATTHTNTPTPTPTPTATAHASATPTATAKPTCNTTLSSAANANASSIVVASATGCDVGDTIKIGGATDSETVKISAVAGNNLTLSTPLTKAHASGSVVVEVASAPSATPTPAKLPQTGGNTGGTGDSVAMLFALTLGVILLAAAGGSIFAARAKRED